MRQSGHLTREQAARIALAAQGFGTPGASTPGVRHLQRVVDRVGQFQIDSVNVVARAQYLPLFSRLGPYDTALLDRAAGSAPRRVFEYWGHEAALLDVGLHPALRFRMAHTHPWGGVRRLMAERPELIETVYELIAAHPDGVTARQIDTEPRRQTTNWGWKWGYVKVACEWLFHAGRVNVVRRNAAFERVYALPERVLPAAILAAPTPDEDEARLTLVRRALAAQGVADVRAVADYFRLRPVPVRETLDRLVAAGEADRVEVVGLSGPWYLMAGASVPRRIEGDALVSPFDSAIFERRRLHDLFGFHYRLEIYVPAHLRRHGYYVYPFLMDSSFVARVDLKADRAAGVLRVQAAWLEEGQDAVAVAPRLARRLESMAGWLGLGDVAVTGAGDLAGPLAASLAC